MSARTAALAAGLCLALPGCTYTASTAPAPARNVITAFNDKVPGKWAVLVEADRLNATVRSQGLHCSAHSFPIDVSQGFPASVRETLPSVLAQVEELDPAAGGAALKRLKARGTIRVRGEELRSRLRIARGLWSHDVAVDVDMSVAVTVDGPGGRLFGRTFEGSGHAERPIGLLCAGGAQAVTAAAEDAQRDVLRRIAEELANSDRVRSGRGG